MNQTVAIDHAGKIIVADGDNPRTLYKHQKDAIRELDDLIAGEQERPFAGLLVIPTGGGKTLTAVYWLLRNYVDNNKKVLWIAHRHELLSQAGISFRENAYTTVLRQRQSFTYRLISGIHDKPKDIRLTDDVIIASKDSLNTKSAAPYLLRWIDHNQGEIFLVVDEAHHAVAKTYRKLIDMLQDKVPAFRMLGLTATPFRTAQNEQGLLKKLFGDDIVFKTDLRTLIHRGILAEPIFEELRTEFDMTEVLSEDDFKKIQTFDINNIGYKTAKTIAENRIRNHRIVSHYLENRQRFGQTLVFALNVDNAIALNKLFREQGIASDYVVSAIRDGITYVTISPEENKRKIEKFRQGELNVLINVNILTEGTDLPKVETVFLTRPTISTILMTQMIGRGLRGEKAGGTKQVFIVSFIDNWKDKIAWVNPEKLFIETNVDFNDTSPDTTARLIRLISIQKIEEFAQLMDQSIDTTKLETLDFIQRIPVGLYAFSILQKIDSDQEEFEKNCEILIYDNIQQAYADFIHDLPELFKLEKVGETEKLSEETVNSLSHQVEEMYFYGCEKLPGYRPEDIKDVLHYYAMYEVQPQFIAFEERTRFDVTKVAKDIYAKRLGGEAIGQYLGDVWQSSQTAWQAFFGYDRRYFVNEVMLAYKKLIFPEDFRPPPVPPQDSKELRELEKLSLAQLRDNAPEYWRDLTNKVFERAKDADGYYTSAKSGFKSKHKIHFQIDHIIPFSRGGPTTLDNLQLLTRSENKIEGDKIGSTQWPAPETDLQTEGDAETPAYSGKTPDGKLLIVITRQGYLRLGPVHEVWSGQNQAGDPVTMWVLADPGDTLLFFTDRGNIYSEKVATLSSDFASNPTVSISQVINLYSREKVLALETVPTFTGSLVVLARRGIITRIDLGEFESVRPSGMLAISPEVSTNLGWVRHIRPGQEIILASRKGQALRFAASELRSMGRTAKGVAAMKLKARDEIASMDVIGDSTNSLLVVTERGFAKKTQLSEYPVQSRNGAGVRILGKEQNPTGPILNIHVFSNQTKLVSISRAGAFHTIALPDIPKQGRATQGRRIIDLSTNDTVATTLLL